MHPWGPWAELLRWDDRRTPEEVLDLLGRVWSVRVRLPDQPRTIDFQGIGAAAASPEDLVSEDYASCQRLAADARAAGELALIVPSAALPGTNTIVLFGPRVLIPWELEPIDLDVDLAAAVTAERASGPLAVLPHVRWRGAPHAGLAAWQAGQPYVFLEPTPTAMTDGA